MPLTRAFSQSRPGLNWRFRLERPASWTTRRRDHVVNKNLVLVSLGGKDLNPQRQDQNLLCYQLHHPRTCNTHRCCGETPD